jgi:hypothetical protein
VEWPTKHQLHGQGGSPTVILESGLGWPAASWNLVQPELAKFTRVCSYDRAGYGWSSEASKPLTSLQMARELHALLVASGQMGPYICSGKGQGMPAPGQRTGLVVGTGVHPRIALSIDRWRLREEGKREGRLHCEAAVEDDVR